jgi:DNA modification methylase
MSQLEYYPPENLTPAPNNARKHSADQIDQVRRSILEFGCIAPIIVDDQQNIIAGHARRQAALKLGLKQVPTIIVDHLSEKQKRAYMLADNKIAENASWDDDLLRIELDYLTSIDLDFDVDLTGFSTGEVDVLLHPSDGNPNEPQLPAIDEKPVITQPGDIWLLGDHKVACGDCQNKALLQELFAEQRAQMVFTDPPYNVKINGHARGLGQQKHKEFSIASGELTELEFENFLTERLSAAKGFMNEGALAYFCMDWRHLPPLFKAGEATFSKTINLCVWTKTNGGMGSLYRSQHELIVVFKHGFVSHINNIELGKHGRYRTNVWNYPGANAFSSNREEALAIHPTVKPTQLIADAIMDVTKANDIVFDGFLGSGSTVLAANSTGRRCYGVELDPVYVDLTVRRWMTSSGQSAVRQSTSQTFSDLEANHD